MGPCARVAQRTLLAFGQQTNQKVDCSCFSTAYVSGEEKTTVTVHIGVSDFPTHIMTFGVATQQVEVWSVAEGRNIEIPELLPLLALSWAEEARIAAENADRRIRRAVDSDDDD